VTRQFLSEAPFLANRSNPNFDPALSHTQLTAAGGTGSTSGSHSSSSIFSETASRVQQREAVALQRTEVNKQRGLARNLARRAQRAAEESAQAAAAAKLGAGPAAAAVFASPASSPAGAAAAAPILSSDSVAARREVTECVAQLTRLFREAQQFVSLEVRNFQLAHDAIMEKTEFKTRRYEGAQVHRISSSNARIQRQ